MGLIDSMIIGAVTFTPLVASLWLILYKYAYPYTKYTYFNGQKLMFAIAGGMVIGLIISLSYRFFPPYILGYALIFAFLEELIRLVILNSPIFQRKFDSLFYGAALGGGTSAMIVSGIAYTTELASNGTIFWTPALLATLVVFSISVTLLNVSNGAMIGYGCGRGKGWTYTLIAVLCHIAFNVALVGVIYPDQSRVGIFFYPSLACILLVSVVLFAYVNTYIVEDALPEDLKKQKRREALAMVRERNRGK